MYRDVTVSTSWILSSENAAVAMRAGYLIKRRGFVVSDVLMD